MLVLIKYPLFAFEKETMTSFASSFFDFKARLRQVLKYTDVYNYLLKKLLPYFNPPYFMPFLKCDIILHCRRQRNKDIDSQHWWRNCATQTMWNTRRTCWSSSTASLSTRRKYKIVFELETSFSVSLVFNIIFVCFIFSSKSH